MLGLFGLGMIGVIGLIIIGLLALFLVPFVVTLIPIALGASSCGQAFVGSLVSLGSSSWEPYQYSKHSGTQYSSGLNSLLLFCSPYF
jgi:hypothetical protein